MRILKSGKRYMLKRKGEEDQTVIYERVNTGPFGGHIVRIASNNQETGAREFELHEIPFSEGMMGKGAIFVGGAVTSEILKFVWQLVESLITKS